MPKERPNRKIPQRPSFHSLLIAFLISVFFTSLTSSCGGGGDNDDDSDDSCTEERWVGAWAAAPSDAIARFSDQSLRMVLTPLRSGKVARVRLSNRFGAEPIRIVNPHLGRQESGAQLVPDSNRPLLFDGIPEATIPPGEDVLSDPIEVGFDAFDHLVVSLFVPSPGGQVTQHAEATQTSYFTDPGVGDQSGEESGEGFANAINSRPLVIGVDVLAPGRVGVIATIGDSITDGAGSTRNQDTRYPDFLARAAIENGHDLSVLNLGIGGNRLLNNGILATFGPSLLKRLEADILSREDVTDVIILEGINDLAILPSASAEEVIEGLQQAVEILKSHSPNHQPFNVLIGTLTPAGNARGQLGPLFQETGPRRMRINEFIRTSGIGDGFVDFDLAIQDPNAPSQLAPAYDSGDGLHPSSAGYERMAEAVDFSIIRGRDCR